VRYVPPVAILDIPVADPWPAPRVHGPVDLDISLPGSKSLTNRALILAAIADGPSVVRRALRSRDTVLMARALSSIGATIDSDGDDWTVTPGEFFHDAAINCGLAGTVMRFVPAVAGLSTGRIVFDGDAHMRTRPIEAVLTALRALGVAVSDGDTLPFTITGSGSVRGGEVVIDASGSSQFISALLLAGARFDEGVEIRHVGPSVPSLPHIEMTVAMLREHAVDVDDSRVNRWSVARGPIRPVDREIEPDLSNAAPFLALAALSGGSVRVRGWPASTTQPGDELQTILSLMGCTVSREPLGLRVTGPARLQGIDLDLHDVGELTPAVAALCALAETPSHLRGVAHIRGHETDRLTALATELGKLGADVTEHPDGLSIRPAPLQGGVLRTYADHRMAHAGVILGAAVDGVRVENVTTTTKTFTDFPGFWASLF
jgi:3-phosphoshikimate 1-carboxyvinyltransferase